MFSGKLILLMLKFALTGHLSASLRQYVIGIAVLRGKIFWRSLRVAVKSTKVRHIISIEVYYYSYMSDVYWFSMERPICFIRIHGKIKWPIWKRYHRIDGRTMPLSMQFERYLEKCHLSSDWRVLYLYSNTVWKT